MSADDTKTLVRLDGLTKHYGDRLILNAVSLEVAAAETVALVGPSGGGKSTLLRCVNGLVPFDAGRVHVGPHTIEPSPSGKPARGAGDVRRLVGMIFQDFQLFPHFNVLQNVIEAPLHVQRRPREEAIAAARQLLDRVGLAYREDAYPRQLSGGQQQRVAIARALAMGPRVLLCDEITSALDPELKSDVLAVIEDLSRDGMTLILVTHEIGFARRAADRVVVLADGRIVEQGPPGQVLDEPREQRTRQFLSRVMA